MTLKLGQENSQKQKESQKQQVSKSPQLIKAIGLHEKSELEIGQVINEETQSNILLEENPVEDEAEYQFGLKTDEDGEHILRANADGKIDADIDWDNYEPNHDDGWPSHTDREENLSSQEKASYSEANDLYFHLLFQLMFSKLNVVQREIGAYIIQNLNEDGYLPLSVEGICQGLGRYQSETVLDTLKIIQTFDPTGIAARDLQECLLIQIKSSNHLKNSLAHKMVKNYWEILGEKKFEEISKDLSVPLSDIKKGFLEIKKLDPLPGLRYAKRNTPYDKASLYVTPDVCIYEDGHRFKIMKGYSRKPIGTNKTYKKMLESDPPLSEKTRQFIMDNEQRKDSFIGSIKIREKTTVKFIESVTRFQEDFLSIGSIIMLKPLIARDVAKDIQMNESTIRRARKNKYVDTPYGLFSSGFFFDPVPVVTNDGKKIASRAVKIIIKSIIDSEDKEKPYRDQELSDILRKEFGIEVKRRVVMKYREGIGFLPARLRKWS